ncbi:ABC-ATPase domain-containing protein [Streptomyces lonarensis]|uniref:ABC-ATPase domain-containing protein n=1 Tax=Streptomyces lonarensis TaxID=700599 RepID=UPI0028AB01FC|nr:ABC-ATPase domain-containing protein [Streptomyces lonarensis]
MRVRQDLDDVLRGLDGAPYGQYKRLTGLWQLDGGGLLRLVRGQADPFAPPARLAVRLAPETAALPAELLTTADRRRAVAAHLAATAARAAGDGPLRVDGGGQEVLDRSSCVVDPDGAVTLRMGAPLPGRGRRIDGPAARRLLCDQLPALLARLTGPALDPDELRRHAACVEDSVALRAMLEELGLVAFVADGAVLPRRSGVSDRPASGPEVVPFASPPELRTTVRLPHAGEVSGMGVPEGVTLVVGGGFHGKSTLLRALESGIWDHVPGDGRELVVARADTVKVRAEDGRRVARVDVHAFVDNLPTGADTTDFSTDNASGSTSQAASLCEAVETGARVLLIDEDTAATNLMIRDARMQALVAADREPLTPFVDLVGSLHRDHGVSTVLVMGGSGDYMEVADRVLLMDAYRPADVTTRARRLVADVPTGRTTEADRFPAVTHRVPVPDSLDPAVRGRPKVRARGADTLSYGEDDIDLRAVAQLADSRQVAGVGLALQELLRGGHLDGHRTLAEALDRLEEHDGLTTATLLAVRDEDFAVPRRHEVAAALNRLRSLRIAAPPA